MILFLAVVMPALFYDAAPEEVCLYQAHRGGLKEAPENTMAAYRHAWAIAGAVPEVDVQTTRDGHLICMHDDTPGRTTDAPPEFKHRKISDIDLELISQWDAGSHFHARFAAEKVPLLKQVLEELAGHPERLIYLDAKDVDLEALAALIKEHGVASQVIFTHERPEVCRRVKEQIPGIRTMTWITGPASLIKSRFESYAAEKFFGVDQIQLHLKSSRRAPTLTYALDHGFLKLAKEQTETAGVTLQLRPFEFDARSLQPLLGLGIRWYATDEPQRFSQALAQAQQDS